MSTNNLLQHKRNGLHAIPDEAVAIETALTQLQQAVTACEKAIASEQQHQAIVLQRRVSEGVAQLDGLAERINALAAQLETELLKFKEVAVEVNRAHRAAQQQPALKKSSGQSDKPNSGNPLNIWEVHSSAIPAVIRRGNQFFLTSKPVELFAADEEKEAEKRALAAQRRRECLERWLEERRKQMIDGFSGL